jgi:hypothetical protein
MHLSFVGMFGTAIACLTKWQSWDRFVNGKQGHFAFDPVIAINLYSFHIRPHLGRARKLRPILFILRRTHIP